MIRNTQPDPAEQRAYVLGGYALLALAVFVVTWGAGVFYWAATI